MSNHSMAASTMMLCVVGVPCSKFTKVSPGIASTLNSFVLVRQLHNGV